MGGLSGKSRVDQESINDLSEAWPSKDYAAMGSGRTLECSL